MFRGLLLVLLHVLVLSSLGFSQNVNGIITRIDNKTILKVWGTHYERGYAHGYLLAEEVKAELEQFMINAMFDRDADRYNSARQYFMDNFTLEEKYQHEVHGIFDGMEDTDINLYCRTLDRNLNASDVYVFTAFTDLAMSGMFDARANFGCSTLSNWGNSTSDDESLDGSLVMCRALDGHMDQVIVDNHLMIVHFPSEQNEVNWLNICFPGMVSTFSAISETGTAAFQNYGGYNRIVTEENLHPVMLSIRNGIEVNDINEDNSHNPWDIAAAVAAYNSLSAWLITSGHYGGALVVESNNENGTETRTENDNTRIPRDNIAATNHYRVLYAPNNNCPRYNAMVDSMNADDQVSIERNWDILSGAAGARANTHFIQYAPQLNLLKWATALDRNSPAYRQEPTVFDLDEVFNHPLSVAQDETTPERFQLSCYPNPFNSSVKIRFYLQSPQHINLDILDCQGRLIKNLVSGFQYAGQREVGWHPLNLHSGLYYLRVSKQHESVIQHLVFLK